MKKIRRGNDILIKWSVTTNGEALPLVAGELTLFIRTAYSAPQALTFEVVANEITAKFLGRDQRRDGIYTLTLYKHYNSEGQAVVDACDAFELVGCTCKADTSEDVSNLTTEVVELQTADLAIGTGGSSGTGERGLSAYEIAVLEGFVGTQAEWVASLSAASEQAAAECREFTAEATEAEQEREDNEVSRMAAEDERMAAEQARATAEQSRVAAENERVAAEQARVAAENERVAAEQARVAAENERVAAEQSRVAAENERVAAEQARVAAEAARAEEFAEMKLDTYSKAEIDAMIGDVESILQTING